jgi:hypothetical protein
MSERDKRELERNGVEAPPEPKRSRFDSAPVAPAQGTTVPKVPFSREALEKAKQVLQLQKQLQDKLKNLPQVTSS